MALFFAGGCHNLSINCIFPLHPEEFWGSIELQFDGVLTVDAETAEAQRQCGTIAVPVAVHHTRLFCIDKVPFVAFTEIPYDDLDFIATLFMSPTVQVVQLFS